MSVDSPEKIRRSSGFRTTARAVGVAALGLGICMYIVDKFLPYRIGPSYYTFYRCVEVLTMVSLAVMVLAVVLAIATFQLRPAAFAGVGFVFLMAMNPVHSGPNPEAWCFNNLRKLDAAKAELAEEKNLTNGTVVTREQLSPYVEGGFATLECAEHGKYIINAIGTEPRCTFHGSMSEMDAKWKKLSQ